ncbi:MFS transporter [Massilia scottii]|uniref:MFS transporter n=1 Tax=Massilia scottii TaxID=3057166 RepID=UPI002796C61A|nr:MFS transporter [Massilia sp. CCM 9029]MDQ1834221.1 MFS transporter [Massilia sp. CCM 9029]
MSSSVVTAGSPAFKRINRAMLCGGFSAFALLYSVQPLMPLLAHRFALTPAQSSWSLSIATLALAVSLVISGALSDRIGRKKLMTFALVGAAGFTVLTAVAQNYPQLLVLRALLGFSLGGMPAVAMAYLSEEIEGPSLGLSMGLYISGTALGGMAGRVIASVASDHYSWRLALGLMGAAGLYAAWEFARSLPESRNFRGGKPGLRGLMDGARTHLRDDGMPWLFGLGFLVMGVFVSLYNYIGYRMLAAPFNMSQSAVGALSVLYLIGMFSSVWAGRLADRIGRRNVLWMVMVIMLAGLVLTLSSHLVLILAGMSLFTFGFFGTHSVTSSWVGRRARAPQALASAMYLFFYYIGSSVIGSVSGLVWSAAGWNGVVGLLALALGLALAIALRLRGLAPIEAVRMKVAA